MEPDATDEEFEAAVDELWAQANAHCCAMNGCYIDPEAEPPDDWDWDNGDWNPPRPESMADTIKNVTDYLKNSV